MSVTTRVTIPEVARSAGVSQPTGSLVPGNHPTARAATGTRERVLEAARALGYRPNVVARSLARRRSSALGIIVPDLGNPSFADVVVAGAERVAAEAGYALLSCSDGERPAAAHLETLVRRQIDGVILDAGNAAVSDDGALAGVIVLLIDEPSERWPGVARDALDAGRPAAERLLALGHRRLAFVGRAADVHTFRLRERGYVRRLREAGVPMSSAWLRPAPANAAGGRHATRALRAERERPAAVFCANKLLAHGALKHCAAARVAVPGAVSIAGCDDIEMARLVSPEPTTVAVARPVRCAGCFRAHQSVRTRSSPGR